MLKIIPLLGFLLIAGCSDKVIEGPNFISEMTLTYYINGEHASEETYLVNLSMNDNCFPNELYTDFTKISNNSTPQVSPGDNITIYRTFNDLQRPKCFKGYHNSVEQTQIGDL